MATWPFGPKSVILYDSFERPGYPSSPTNPGGRHWAHDASRYRKNGALLSLGGTKFFSPIDGVVVREGYDRGWGWYVRIRAKRGNQDVWTFAHFAYRVRVRVGQSVTDGRGPNGIWRRRRQTLLGYIGSTGNSTAPHMHTERHEGPSMARDPRKNPFPVYVKLKGEL